MCYYLPNAVNLFGSTLFGRYQSNPFLLMNTVPLCAKSELAEEWTPLWDFSESSNADWCTLYPTKIKCTVQSIWSQHQIFHLHCFFDGNCHCHTTFLFGSVQASYCHHPLGSRKSLTTLSVSDQRILFITVLNLGVFLRLTNLLPITTKSEELLLKKH